MFNLNLIQFIRIKIIQELQVMKFDDYNFIDREGEIKNQYSTFIQEIEEQTEKLMDEVFNKQYQPQVDQDQSQGNASTRMKNYRKYNTEELKNEDFRNFMRRNERWVNEKQKNLIKKIMKEREKAQAQLTFNPQILRGSKQKIPPIYIRAQEIHKQKHQNIAYKKIQRVKNEQKFIKQLPFHPKINQKFQIPHRTLSQYLSDKQKWTNSKNQSINQLKIITEAKKYTQCIFSPLLKTEKYNKTHQINSKRQKVQDRLLESMQKSMQKKMQRT